MTERLTESIHLQTFSYLSSCYLVTRLITAPICSQFPAKVTHSWPYTSKGSRMNRHYALDFTMALPLCAILFCIPFVCASLPGLNDTHILTLDASDCPSCNTRTLWDIISSCGLTLFVCTWTAIHMDIPSRTSGIFHQLFDRPGLMLITFLAPEIIVGLAAWEYLFAYKILNDINCELQHAKRCSWQDILKKKLESWRKKLATLKKLETWRKMLATLKKLETWRKVLETLRKKLKNMLNGGSTSLNDGQSHTRTLQ
jgi:hypothetical protein